MLIAIALTLPLEAQAQWFRNNGSYLPSGYSPLHYWAPNLYRWHLMHHGPRIPMHAMPAPVSGPVVYPGVPVRNAEPPINPGQTNEPATIEPIR